MSELNKIQTYLHKASTNKKLYVFLSCLCLTFFFWILNALDNTYVTNLSFPVVYSKSPKNHVVLNDLPDQLTIKVKGLGYDLLGYQLKFKDNTIRIDLSNIKSIKPKQNLYTSNINFNVFKPSIFAQLGSQIELNEIFPKQVELILDERVEKVLEVKPDLSIDFEQQYQIYGDINIKPAVVNVTGPKSIVDTLPSINTSEIKYSGVDESLTEQVGFNSIYYDKKISFDYDQVLLTVPVEKFTEASLSVNLEKEHVPDSIEVKVIPNQIDIKFLLPLSKVSSINNNKVNAVVDCSNIEENSSRKLKVSLKKYPEYLKNITIKPSKVEYIITKK